MLRSALRLPEASERESAGAVSPSYVLAGMLLLGLFVRLLFIHAEGFKADVSTFEAWSLRLAENPLSSFYPLGGLTDYPPGYLYVLWAIGHAYKAFVHGDPTYSTLKVFVKLPSVLMDLVDAVLIFAIVRRFAPLAAAFAAAALFTFNPAFIFTSADWGQVDSVAGGVTLLALLCLMAASRSDGGAEPPADAVRTRVICAWLLLAFSILTKPVAVILVPVFLAWAFTTDSPAVRRARLSSTGLGVLCGLVLAFVASVPFHPTANPLELFGWLAGRYEYAANIYAYNSVNAFNLYVAPFKPFWQPDTNLVPNLTIAGHAIGLPQYVWGLVLFAVAVGLVLSRYVQRRDAVATLEAAMIVSLGYFVLSTRMHERYIFNAVMLAVPLIWYRKRYLYAAIALSLTLFANILYSLDYGYVLDAKVPGVNPFDLWPLVSHPAAILNVVAFFYLGYVFLGAGGDVVERWDAGDAFASLRAGARTWFSPVEGVARMLPVDWAIASVMTVGSFALSFADYTWPSEKIFDEIYYARAGEEYLSHKEIFEFTHPPLTKLWITLSMTLFGGLHGLGDTAAGWRFLNLVMGAVMVLVLYCFAKRLIGSTPWAAACAGLLLFDGFHYVQSRIATPEITVAFFTLLTLYAFYRFWLASQVRVAAFVDRRLGIVEAAAIAGGLLVAFAASAVLGGSQAAPAHVAIFLYVGAACYLAVRLFAPRLTGAALRTSYADGAWIAGTALVTPGGGSVPIERGATAARAATPGAGELVYEAPGLVVRYGRDGRERYETPAGTAVFTRAGGMTVGDATIDGRRDGLLWLLLLSLSMGCLAASKWNGLFDFFVIWLLVAAVVSQRYWAPVARAIGVAGVAARPASWGNPFGFSLDVTVVGMLFVAATVYTLTYIPYFSLGHNLADLVGLQQQMFAYHDDLRATHPYGSSWWQWPLLLRPISYFYHDWRTGANAAKNGACCVAEILALPNPAVWWLGLVSVPFLAFLAWRERVKGYALLVTAYLLQWLPWAASPRVAFEYHFFPNLAIICLANAVLLERVWRLGAGMGGRYPWPRLVVGAYLAGVVGLFAFFFPILAGLHVPWNVWDARMWHSFPGGMDFMKNHWV